MSVQRPFSVLDLFKFNNINLDVWTETYRIDFYLSYLVQWPELCLTQQAPSGGMMGYILGKVEGSGSEWHGHITALTVAPAYRRLALARSMVARLELVSDTHYRAFFVDLYVRCNNALAIAMYEGFGYSVFRRVREYYGSLVGGRGKAARDEEDAFDMRKPLSQDPARRSVRPNGREIVVKPSSVS